jgi:hypothetical protein
MPTSIATATVFALALIPGACGAYVWALINGQDWREKEWQAALRYLMFSIAGLAIYVIAGMLMRLPPALHVIPSTYEGSNLKASSLGGIFLPYLGHIVGAVIAGIVAALAHRVICYVAGSSPQPSTWDHFLKNSLPKHWVVVTLKSGDVYAGYVRTAEESAPSGERDIVIRQPAKYDDKAHNYRVTSMQDLFVPAELVQNIGTVRSEADAEVDPKVGNFLFPESEPHVGTEQTLVPTSTETVAGTSG